MDKMIISFVMRFRVLVLILLFGITAFFGYGVSKMDFYTQFLELFPYNHQYVKIHKQFMDTFGGAHIATIAIEVQEGDVFNKETLEKMVRIQDAVSLIPGVNPYQIFSIASPRVMDIMEISGGFQMERLMKDVPQNQEEMEAFKEIVYTNEVYGTLVSTDQKALLLNATFIEERMDFNEMFKHFVAIQENETDSNHHIYFCGEPVLYGWIYHYVPQMVLLFGISALVLILLLYYFMGKQPYWWLPLISAGMSAVWGLGFSAFLGFHFDPLIIVIPFLLSARAMSHGVQWLNRFTEEYKAAKNIKTACYETGVGLFNPSMIGIITDACGILIVAMIPIPILRNLAYLGFFWGMSVIFTVVLLLPVMVSFFAAPKNFDTSNGQHMYHRAYITNMMLSICRWSCGKGRIAVILLAFVFLLIGINGMLNMQIGDANPGSPTLWRDSEYNQSVEKINQRFPGVDQMYIQVEGKGYIAILQPDTLRAMEKLQNYLVEKGVVAYGTSSADMVKSINRLLHGNDPKFGIIPLSLEEVVMLFAIYQMGTSPEDLDKWMDYTWYNTNLRLFLRDHRGETLKNVISEVNTWVADPENVVEHAIFRPAGGLGGILAAANELIEKANLILVLGILGFVFLCCAVVYRSFVAGFIFVISLILANFSAFAYMSWRGIGLNINTLPVVSLGVGLGVDYGLYIVTRIKEIMSEGASSWQEAIFEGISSTGRAVFYQATMMSFSVFFWLFSTIRFQAEMGFALAILMLVNMFVGVILIPALLITIKPSFMTKDRKHNKVVFE